MSGSKSTTTPHRNAGAILQQLGQSVWLDFVRRSLITSGDLARLVENDGVTGVTSNPTIFEKAIGGSDDYTAAIDELRRESPDLPARAAYERLAITDIQGVADALRGAYERTSARDGYVSLEVSPGVANDTDATIREARQLWKAVARPNLMIKVPGTKAGIPAVRTLTSEAINVNITLLFGRERYEAVAHAFIEGLQERLAAGEGSGKTERPAPRGSEGIQRIASVASFFVSRIDTRVDKLLEEKLEQVTAAADRARLERLVGTVAIANARLAYQSYQKIFSGPGWEALAAKGGRTQRLLWASTGVKNPRYRDVLYVEELIGPDTVNTMPLETLAAFRDHGEARPTLEAGLAEATRTLADLQAAGISLNEVTDQLLVDGLKQFEQPFNKLLETLEQRLRQPERVSTSTRPSG